MSDPWKFSNAWLKSSAKSDAVTSDGAWGIDYTSAI